MASGTPRRIELTYLAVAAIAALVSLSSIILLRFVTKGSERVISQYAHDALAVEKLRTFSESKSRAARGYLLSGQDRFLEGLKGFRADFQHGVDALRPRLAEVPELSDALDRAVARDAEMNELTDRAIHARQGEQMGRVFTEFGDGMSTARERLDEALDELAAMETERVDTAERNNRDRERLALFVAVAGLCFTVGMSVALWLLLTRARREAARYLDALRSSNADLEAFGGRIAHDFKNILGPVSLTAAALERGPNPERTAEGARRIQRVMARANRMIDGLLAFSRAEAVGRASGLSRVSDVVEAVLEELDSLKTQVGATVEVEVEEAAAACEPALLHMALLNVVSNGLKFMAGRPTRRLRITARTQRDRVWIDVEDTGPGISPEDQARVFDPFFRARGSAHIPGSGIGLATVRRIAEACGGEVRLESRPGIGTTVQLALPSALRPEPPDAPQPTAH